MRIYTDLFGAKVVEYEPGDPAYTAATVLAESVKDWPGWNQAFHHGQPDSTAQRIPGLDRFGFRHGPWAGITWDCGTGGAGYWSGFVHDAGEFVWRDEIRHQSPGDAIASVDPELTARLSVLA